jgi:hypothetical protein
MKDPKVIGIGSAEEQRHFIDRHDSFFDRFPNLRKMIDAVFVRQFSGSEPADRVVFSLGRLCVEDFMEILVLAGNAYGIGALKILRGMYERAVTAWYLHLNPEQTEDYLDFFWVSQHRLARAVADTFGEGILPRNKLEETERMYQQVRHRFLVTACGKCGTKQLNYTWTKLDFVSLARRVGSIGQFVVPAYYIPTEHAHSTVRAILSRLEEGETDGIILGCDAQRSEADDALRLGHLLLLSVLDLQREHFKLRDSAEDIQRCIADYNAIWLSASGSGSNSTTS